MTISQQHRYETWAAGLLALLLLLTTVYSFFDGGGIWDRDVANEVYWFVLFTYLLDLLICYYVWRGQRWAKALFLLTEAGAIYFAAHYHQYPTFESAHPLTSLTNILHWAGSLTAAVLVLLSLRKPTTEAPLPAGE